MWPTVRRRVQVVDAKIASNGPEARDRLLPSLAVPTFKCGPERSIPRIQSIDVFGHCCRTTPVLNLNKTLSPPERASAIRRLLTKEFDDVRGRSCGERVEFS